MYKVRLQSFEGPFDLLVYLIETAEMNIYDIKISQITNQYLEYMQAMKERDVFVSTEFMVLAASLIEIKSKMILPRVSQEDGALLEEDPRTELVERLLEYKRFKQAARLLEEREESGTRIFEKPQEDISIYLQNPDEYLSLDIKQFAAAFRLFIEKKQGRVCQKALRACRTRACLHGKTHEPDPQGSAPQDRSSIQLQRADSEYKGSL